MAAITTDHLTKYYGSCRGIEDLVLEVEEGEVFGFLGPNGAGKTTTIRLLLGLIRPTRGRFAIFGTPVRFGSFSYRNDIGYLPGEVCIHGNLTGHEFLARLAALRGSTMEKGNDLARRLKLDLSKTVKGLSHGNRQKLAIVQAFMHDARLLILDEPTSGLDPLTQQAFFEMIREESDRGTTILLSSHILSEVERACSRVGIVREGRLVAVERIDDLKKKRVKHAEVELGTEVDAKDFHLPAARSVRIEGRKVRFTVEKDYRSILEALSAYPVEDITIRDAALEDIFLEYYSDSQSDPQEGEPCES